MILTIEQFRRKYAECYLYDDRQPSGVLEYSWMQTNQTPVTGILIDWALAVIGGEKDEIVCTTAGKREVEVAEFPEGGGSLRTVTKSYAHYYFRIKGETAIKEQQAYSLDEFQKDLERVGDYGAMILPVLTVMGVNPTRINEVIRHDNEPGKFTNEAYQRIFCRDNVTAYGLWEHAKVTEASAALKGIYIYRTTLELGRVTGYEITLKY